MVQALVLVEPIKFALLAFVIACLPSKTKKRCMRCMQGLTICGPLVVVAIGTSITAIMEGLEVEGEIEDMEDMDMEEVEVDTWEVADIMDPAHSTW